MYPQMLYNLTDLQQDAYRRFKMGPKDTLNTLQNLYERHKIVTYPRTDSNYLTNDMVDTIKERLQALLATEYKAHVRELMSQSFSPKMNIFNDGKVSDHHAIIPTEVRPSLDQLSQRELKIYTIIVQRFLETLMKPYEYENVVINFGIKDLIFTLKENIPKQLGFKALKEEELRQTSSHRFTKNLKFKVQKVNIHEHETKAPDYFNEGSLLKAMENPQNYINFSNKSMLKLLNKLEE